MQTHYWRGQTVVRLCMAGALALGGAAGCEAVAGPEVESRADVTASTGSIGGSVSNLDGHPVAGAQVRTSGGAVTTTNAAGAFLIGGLPPAERLPVTVEAPGYVSTTKVYQVVAGQTLTRPIRIQPLAAPVVVMAGAGGEVAFGGTGRVVIPANAFAGVGPGEPVSVRATYIDPYNAGQLSTSPGDFTARTLEAPASSVGALAANGDTVRLETFGMLDVDARDSQGQRLELAAGQQVTVSFPLRGQTPATTRGLWSFDEQQGVWVPAGTATVTPTSIDGTIGSVTQTANVDDPFPPVCIRVRTLRMDNITPRPYEFVSATGVSYNGYTQGWTNTQGIVSLSVRSASQVAIDAGTQTQTVTTPGPGNTGCPLVATFAF